MWKPEDDLRINLWPYKMKYRNKINYQSLSITFLYILFVCYFFSFSIDKSFSQSSPQYSEKRQIDNYISYKDFSTYLYDTHFNNFFKKESFSKKRAIPKINSISSGFLDKDKKPWTSSWWPNSYGGIAFRWNSKEWNPKKIIDHSNGKYLFSKDEIFKMSQQEISFLSPSEKYDLLVAEKDKDQNYKYSLTNKILSQKNIGPHVPIWYGICHGWAAAAFTYKEPSPVTLENSDGVKIPFGSADIKALLSYSESQDR